MAMQKIKRGRLTSPARPQPVMQAIHLACSSHSRRPSPLRPTHTLLLVARTRNREKKSLAAPIPSLWLLAILRPCQAFRESHGWKLLALCFQKETRFLKIHWPGRAASSGSLLHLQEQTPEHGDEGTSENHLRFRLYTRFLISHQTSADSVQ